MLAGMKTGMENFRCTDCCTYVGFATPSNPVNTDDTFYDVGGKSMMRKAGLRKEHISMVDWMNSRGGRSGVSILMEEDLLKNGMLY